MQIFFRKNKNQLTSKGISLVEMLIYVALLALLVVVLTSTTVVLLRSYKQMTTNQIIDSSALLTLDRITSTIRSSNSIDFSNTTFDSSSGVLSLNARSPADTAYIAKFYVNDGVVKMDVDGVYEGQLTSSSTEIVSLMFRYIDTPVSDAIRTEITLTTDVNGFTKSENFYTTTILKNSY
jgi:hypothetical protein